MIANLKLYAGIGGVLALLASYAAVYNAGYRARATHDASVALQAKLDAATKDKQRLELAAKMTADETRTLATVRQTLQERVHALETELTNPRSAPAQPVVGPVAVPSCRAEDGPYRATPADVARLRAIRHKPAKRKPAAAPGVRAIERAAPSGG